MKKDEVLVRIINSLNVLNKLSKNITEHELFDNITERREKLRKIDELTKKLERYKLKLERDEIEIAFMGQEKVGKSAFINAFIRKNILPSAQERATYTVTELRYAEKGKVVVEFYTEEEFLKEVFRPLLREIGYPKPDEQDLYSVSVDDLEKHFESLKEKNKALYNEHINRGKNDLLDMLNARQTLKTLFATGRIEFPEDRLEDYKPYITDRYKSRAVRSVTIYSERLEDIPNVVVYDLPGFDSPTFSHSKFTIDKVKDADAVVMLRLDDPSFKGPEVEIIKATREDDGVELKEKLFFFINKIDRIHTIDEFNIRLEKFKNELIANGLDVGEERIFCGSALAVLYACGEDKSEEARIAYDKIKSTYGDKFINSIDEIYHSLVNYANTERSKILERRINAIIEETKKFIDDVLQTINVKAEELDVFNFVTDTVLEVRREAYEKIKTGLEEYINREKKQLDEKKPLSTKLKQHVQTEIKNLSQEEIEQIKQSIEARSSSSHEQPEALNKEWRMELLKRTREKFSGSFKTIIKIETDRIEDDLTTLFVEALKPDEESVKPELKNKAKEFIHEKMGPLFEESAIELLVDRFSQHIIELMMTPLGVDRYNKFKDVEKEVFSLFVFHKGVNLSKSETLKLAVFNVLVQEPTIDAARPKFEEILKDKNLTEQLFKHLEETFVFVPYDYMLREIEKYKSFFEEHGVKFDDLKSISNKIYDYISAAEEGDMLKVLLNERRAQNYEDVKNEIENDIANLKDVLQQCVVSAINPEDALKNQLTKYVNILIAKIDGKDFDKFIKENIKLIRQRSLSEAKKIETRKIRLEEIISDLQDLKAELDGRLKFSK